MSDRVSLHMQQDQLEICMSDRASLHMLLGRKLYIGGAEVGKKRG